MLQDIDKLFFGDKTFAQQIISQNLFQFLQIESVIVMVQMFLPNQMNQVFSGIAKR